MGCDSVTLAPITNITSDLEISSIEFVVVLRPRVLLRAFKVGAWHSVSDWSILLVPIAALANFCIR